MKRYWLYILPGVFFLCVSANFAPGDARGGAGTYPPPTASLKPRPEGQQAPVPARPVFMPSRKSDRIERVSIPAVADRTAGGVALDRSLAVLPLDPPSQKFLNGVFHRYRPRDPTIS